MSDSSQNDTANTQENRQTKTEHLEPYQWKPGQSGNPSGRPKKLPITEAFQRIFSDPVESEQFIRSIMASKSQIARVMIVEKAAERLEGKVTQPVEHSGEINLTLADRMGRAKERVGDGNS